MEWLLSSEVVCVISAVHVLSLGNSSFMLLSSKTKGGGVGGGGWLIFPPQ